MAFVKDVRVGRVAERLIVDLFKRSNIRADLNQSTSKTRLAEWDVQAYFEGKTFLVESKYDIYEQKSGNIAVEYYNPRSAKPSGLYVTKANLWAFVLADNSVWITRVKDLKAYFETMPALRDIACGGDGNAAMRLYRRDDIFGAIFQRIDGLTPEQLRSVLEELLS